MLSSGCWSTLGWAFAGGEFAEAARLAKLGVDQNIAALPKEERAAMLEQRVVALGRLGHPKAVLPLVALLERAEEEEFSAQGRAAYWLKLRTCNAIADMAGLDFGSHNTVKADWDRWGGQRYSGREPQITDIPANQWRRWLCGLSNDPPV
jgi:hypothetical protein